MPALLIKPPAEKDIRDLPAAVRDRIVVVIRSLRESPFPHGAHRLQGLEHRYRLRVGDYRVLYECDAGTQTITIYRVKHRRDAYR